MLDMNQQPPFFYTGIPILRIGGSARYRRKSFELGMMRGRWIACYGNLC